MTDDSSSRSRSIEVQVMTDHGITVLVVDDQPIFHEMVKRVVSREPDMSVVAVAESVKQALALAQEHRPDVVLMDQQLPDGHGTDAAGRINAVVQTARVVMVTATADDRTLTEAKRAGCAGYILKDRLIHDLPEAIRAAHRGDLVLPAHGVDLFFTSLIDDDEPT